MSDPAADAAQRAHEVNGWPKSEDYRELLNYLTQWPENPFLPLPDDPFDPSPWLSLLYNDVDLDAIDWADEMRKLPGQFTRRACFPEALDRRIIAEAVHELTGAI